MRKNRNQNTTGDIIKIENTTNFTKNMLVHLYLIAYFDNAKANIEYYGMFNQPIDEEKLFDNIKREKTYGEKGLITPNYINRF